MCRARWVGVFLLVVGWFGSAQDKAPTPKFSAARRSELRELYKQYVQKPDKRTEILASIRKDDVIPKADVSSFTQLAFELARAEGPRLDKGGKFAHPKYPGQIILSGAGQGHKGLVIGLHGGGEGSGDGSEAAAKYGGLASKGYICIFPTVLEKKACEWGANPAEEEFVMELVRSAIRTYGIDTNRIVIIGASMGGYGAWHIGGHNADVFAGISSHAGGILYGESKTFGGGIIANLYQTPIFFTHGAKDEPAPVQADHNAAKILDDLQKKYGGYEHKYIEYPDLGHTCKPEDMKASIEWLAQRKRNPNPKKLIWEPLRNRTFFWLAVDEPKDGMRVEAEIKGNEIEITGQGPVSLLLNEKLVNLGKKVVVRLNDKEVFNDFAPSSASAVIESIAEKLDSETVYTARIDLK